jgi:hypothetical protein
MFTFGHRAGLMTFKNLPLNAASSLSALVTGVESRNLRLGRVKIT